MLSLWKSVWCPKSDTIASDAEERACEEANRNQLSIELCWRPRNSEWDLNSNWRIQNLNCYGNFPRTGHKETQDVVSWSSAPETVLRLMDMEGHFTIIYCLQVWEEKKKKDVKQIRIAFEILLWTSKKFDVSGNWCLMWVFISFSRLTFSIYFHLFFFFLSFLCVW